MDFNNMVDESRSQVRFYQAICLSLIGLLAILAVIVPSSLKNGPYVIQEASTASAVSVSQPWRLSVARIEGFLKMFLSNRFEWTKETFDQKKSQLKNIVTEAVQTKLKESIVGYGAIAKSQDAKGYYVLEGFRFSNEQHLIEAQVSRIIRLGTTGVVTPLVLRLVFEDMSVSDANPYGLRVKAIEEGEISQTPGASK